MSFQSAASVSAGATLVHVVVPLDLTRQDGGLNLGLSFAASGTKPGLRSQTLISTGQADLDRILGGGLPLGTILCILEDGCTKHHDTLLRLLHNMLVWKHEQHQNQPSLLVKTSTPLATILNKHCCSVLCRYFVAEGVACLQDVLWTTAEEALGSDPLADLPQLVMPSSQNQVCFHLIDWLIMIAT